VRSLSCIASTHTSLTSLALSLPPLTDFATYLSAYSVLLSSIVGVMVCHYYVIGKRQVAVHDLYEKDGLYTYFHGFNLRAYAAYVAGIAPNITGMAGACGADVPLAATRIYTLSFFVGFGVAFATYWLLCLAFPLPVPTVDEVAEVPAALASGAARGELKRQSSTETGYEVEKDEKADEEGAARGAVELV